MMKEADSFMNGVRHALNLPIRSRCAELTVLFDRGSILELQNFFPILIDHIFGPQGTINWGLRNTLENTNEDFRQLQHFLSPCGPLFKLIYTLLKDPCAKYDFPIAFLPIKVQQILENAQSHPFYADLVHVNTQTKRLISLLLNPFDYYMFHFAYHLINPWHQRNILINPTNWNTVYYVLCCDYMLHFLPTDPNYPVLPIIFYYGKNPMHFQPLQNDFRSPSKLINTNSFNKSQHDYTNRNSFINHHPRNDIWRSETVLTVFVDMWLNSDQVSRQQCNMNSSFNSSSQSMRLLQYNELPSGEYMRIVRVLMKQLHSFSASSKIDDTHMSELKKIAIPMLQGKFYIFLRNLIHRWPLDGSFRLVLELWLTYIQPWRYPPNTINSNNKNLNSDLDDLVNTINIVDRSYLPFIAENLLTYVVIFQQLLPRFTRVDLISPKMAVMLYRITKVFNQSNLASLIKEIEYCVENNHSPSHSYNSHFQPNLPPLNPTTNWSTNTINNLTTTFLSSTSTTTNYYNNDTNNSLLLFDLSLNNSNNKIISVDNICNDKKWSVIVRQKIYELEGQSFYYKPLFTTLPAPEVYELIIQIKKSIKISQELIEIKQNEELQFYSGFWGLIKSLFETPITNDEFTLNDRLKVPPYLETSLQNLIEMFQIKDLPNESDFNNETTINNQSITGGGGAGGGGGGGMDISDDFKFLTQNVVRERIKKIKYEGDPDLHPIRSNEIKFFVRAFYQLALKINEKYGLQFSQLYYNQNYWGRLSRQILSPPLTIYKYDKSKYGSPRISSELPPRISLRRYTTYNFLIHLIVGGILVKLIFGYNFTTYLFFLILICLLYKSIKAIPSTTVRHNYPTQGFGNISFNDSF